MIIEERALSVTCQKIKTRPMRPRRRLKEMTLWVQDVLRTKEDGKSFDGDGGAAGADHQHRGLRTDGLVVEVDAHNGIRTKLNGLPLDFLQGDLAGPSQLLFVGCRAPPDNVAYAGKEVLEDISTEDGLACHYRMILLNRPALNGGGR